MSNYLLREALSKRWHKDGGWTRFPSQARQFLSKENAQAFNDEHLLGSIPVSLGDVEEIQFARLIHHLDEAGILTKDAIDHLVDRCPITHDKTNAIISKAREVFESVLARVKESTVYEVSK